MVLTASLTEWDREKRLEVCFIHWNLSVTKDIEGLRDVTMNVVFIYSFYLSYSNAISQSVFHKVPRRGEALTTTYKCLLVTHPAGQIMGDPVCCQLLGSLSY